MKNKIVFCDDDTCRFNGSGVCIKDQIHIEVTTSGFENGKDVFYNYCRDYEDKRNDRESNGK